MEQLRSTILAQEDVIASRIRFGLFSQPPPLGLGDDSQYQTKKANKGQDGKPKTQPRQILAGVNRSGVLKKSFINVPESIYQKDPYVDTFKKDLQYDNQKHTRSPMHQNDFVPASGPKTITNSVFPYVEQKQFEQKKARRDEGGKVKTQPSNVITNPTSKVEMKLFKTPVYMPDPYNRPQQIQKQEKEIWRSKIKQEVMFKSMSHGNSNFTKDKVQYGIDEKSKTLMSQKKSMVYGHSKIVSHQTKFKLARRGHGDPIGRYPQYVKPRDRVQTEVSAKVRTETNEEQKDDWKPATGKFTRPSPSISLMSRNMRKYV